jgi:hypothetical protein
MAAGKKTGGRTKGTPNKATKAREELITSSGLSPLEYMLTTLRDESQPVNIRLDAAKAAAQYVHPKLSAVTLSGDPENPVEQRVTHVDEKQVGAAVEKLTREY